MEVTLIVATGFVCMACFLLGARVGQTVSKGEEVKLPSMNPMDAVRAHNEKKEAQMAQNRIDTIMRNIDGYDGTGSNQEDVPGR